MFRRSFVAAIASLHLLSSAASPLSPVSTALPLPNNKTSALGNETIIRHRNQQPIEQKVFLHVLSAANDTNGFDGLIDFDTSSLNTTFATSGITFNIVSTDYTINRSWFNAVPGSAEDKAMKSALRIGGYDDLNIFFINNSIPTVGKACTPPSSNPTVDEKAFDGCLIGYHWSAEFQAPELPLPTNETDLHTRARIRVSFDPVTDSSINPLAPEIGRWLAMDIKLSSNCFDSVYNATSVCVFEQGTQVATGPVWNGHGPRVGLAHRQKCFNETLPVLCMDSTKTAADVEARVERAVLYAIGSANDSSSPAL